MTLRRPGKRAKLRVILGAVLACLAVVVLPVEAWGATGPSGIVTGSSTGSVGTSATCPTSGAAFTGTTSCHNSSFAIYVTISGSVSMWYGVQTYYSGAWQNLTGSTYSGATGWSNTYWGAASPVIPDDKPVRYAFVDNSTGATLGAYTLRDAVVPSTCSFTATAGLSSGTLSVEVVWAGARPAGGWKVFAPGSSSSPGTGTPALTVSPSGNLVPGHYPASGTAPSGFTSGDVRIESAASSGCYVVVTVGTSPAGSVPDNGTDASGNDCGLNPFCYIGAGIRAAFMPSASFFSSWSTLRTTVETHPPGSVAFWAKDVLTSAFAPSAEADVPGFGGGILPVISPQLSGCGRGPTNTTFCEGDSTAGVPVLGEYAGSIRLILAVGLWVAFALGAWKRVSNFLGSNG